MNLDLKTRSANYYNQWNNRPEMMQFIPKNAQKILDVGCAQGLFGERLKKELKAEVWGIEIDQKSAKKAQVRIDKVLIGDISDLLDKIPNDYFDCVIFNDVLEHLVDPYSLLKKIKSKLNLNGVVVCSLPNIRFFYTLKALVLGKEWKYVDIGILDKTHLRFFTQKSIEDMFKILGYRILKLKGIHELHSWKFSLLNFLLFGALSDIKYSQFACVAKPTKGA